jgi:hypothetical protein
MGAGPAGAVSYVAGDFPAVVAAVCGHLEDRGIAVAEQAVATGLRQPIAA